MNIALRLAATVLIGAGAAAALGRVVVVQHRCNRELKLVEQRMELARRSSDDYRVATITRSNVEVLERCEAAIPFRVDFPMLIGGNHWLGSDGEGARRAYLRALEVDRRPEIYLNLGLVEFELGDPHATADLKTACLLEPVMVYQIPEPLRSQIAAELRAAPPIR